MPCMYALQNVFYLFFYYNFYCFIFRIFFIMKIMKILEMYNILYTPQKSAIQENI